MGVDKIAKLGLKAAFVVDDLKGLYEDELRQMRRNLALAIEGVFIAGLQRKGLCFNNRYELAEFIKSRCRATDNPMIKERIYYVDDIPFLIHYYEITVDSQTDRNKVTASGGSYRYI